MFQWVGDAVLFLCMSCDFCCCCCCCWKLDIWILQYGNPGNQILPVPQDLLECFVCFVSFLLLLYGVSVPWIRWGESFRLTSFLRFLLFLSKHCAFLIYSVYPVVFNIKEQQQCIFSKSPWKLLQLVGTGTMAANLYLHVGHQKLQSIIRTEILILQRQGLYCPPCLQQVAPKPQIAVPTAACHGWELKAEIDRY